MADPEDREQESQATEDTRFDREAAADSAAREDAAKRLQADPPPQADES